MLKEEYEGKGGHRRAALLRGILNPRARWEKMHSEGHDFGGMLASWKKDVAQYRVAAGADLQQAVQVASVMAHAPAADRDLWKVVHLANRETYQALRAYVREWTMAQRTYEDLERHTTPDTSAPMDIGQVKGTQGKGKQDRKGKGERQGQERDNGEAKERDDSYVAGECGCCGKWGHKKSQCRRLKRERERSWRRTSGLDSTHGDSRYTGGKTW